MKSIVTVIIAILAIHVNANACNYEAVKTARTIEANTKMRLDQGFVPAIDLVEAKAHVLNMEFCRMKDKDENICKDLTTVLKDLFEATMAAEEVGLRNTGDITRVHARLAEVQSQCK